MTNDVLGKNVLIEAEIDSVFYPLLCCKTAEFTAETDEIETTHVNSGADREFAPGLTNRVLNMNGITRVNNADGRINIIYLMQQQAVQTIFNLRATLTANNGDLAVITFSAFLKSTNWSKDVSTTSNCFANWRITGSPEYAAVVPEPSEPVCDIEDPLYLTLAEGETSVSDALLGGAQVSILTVAREGIVYAQTSGTPGNMQFRHSGDEIQFLNPGNPGGETIYILYKIIALIP
jgi:hypothetical protein